MDHILLSDSYYRQAFLIVVNLNINPANLKQVVTANGTQQVVSGLADVPININNHIQFQL